MKNRPTLVHNKYTLFTGSYQAFTGTALSPDDPEFSTTEMLHIDPDECIDCDACVEACPVDACFAEDQLPPEWESYTQRNAQYFAKS